LLTVFQSEFRRHNSTTVAVLKVMEDIRLNMEDGLVTVLVLLDFSQASLIWLIPLVWLYTWAVIM
jgi:hypothetical protein